MNIILNMPIVILLGIRWKVNKWNAYRMVLRTEIDRNVQFSTVASTFVISVPFMLECQAVWSWQGAFKYNNGFCEIVFSFPMMEASRKFFVLWYLVCVGLCAHWLHLIVIFHAHIEYVVTATSFIDSCELFGNALNYMRTPTLVAVAAQELFY